MKTDNQVERALEGVPDSPPEAHNPEAPLTPFPTSCVLNREQEDAVVDHVMGRLTTLEQESGRIIQPQGQAPTPNKITWMGRREMWTLRYYNHVADRARKGTIFEFSNLTASLSQRITMQMIARANNFFFETTPWFAATPVLMDGDTELEERINRHLHWKFQTTNLVRTMASANEYAFVRGEAVTKTTYVKKQQRYKKKGVVYVGPDGKPLPDAEGNPIFEDAVWMDEMVPGQPEEASPEQVALAGAPVAEAPFVPSGRLVLKSDGVTVQPPPIGTGPDGAPIFAQQEGLWDCHVTTDEGADCAIVYFKDFLCPLDAPSIHDADINIHLYSLPVMRLVEMFKREDLGAAGVKDLETLRLFAGMVRGFSAAGEGSGQKQPRGDHGEDGNTSPLNSPDTDVVEAWVRFDADGDGIQEELLVVIDRVTRYPIFYDYTANVTTRGRRPFEVVRSRAVDGRWYGIGAMEYFEPEQEFIDLTINRRNFRMSQAGRVTFWAPHMTVEGRANPNLKLHWGATYTLCEGFKAEDALAYIELPDDSDNLMELLNFYMQLMQLKSGVINAGDQEASGLPTSNTATGINDVAKSGQEMFSQYLSSLQVGQQDTLMANVLTTYRNLNKPEIFRYFQGDTAGLDEITPDDVRTLSFMVTILLTRQQTEKVLQTSAQASNLVKDFYAQPPIIQVNVADFYREAMNALGYNNGRKTINPVPVMNTAPADPNTMGAIGGGQAAANTGAPAAAEPAQPAPVI